MSEDGAQEPSAALDVWEPRDAEDYGRARRLGIDPDSPFSGLLLASAAATPDGAAPVVAPGPGLDPVEDALEAVASGGVVVVVDDADRENEGDLIMAAEFVTPEKVAFFLRHTSGVLCAALTSQRCDELRLPLMVADNSEALGTAFTVTVDARAGTTTGISPADRATTMQTLADPATAPDDLARPGHVFPLRARDGGVLRRPGHTEATVDLARLAGLTPAGLLCEVTTADRSGMARRAELARLAARFGMPMISVADLIRYRRRTERLVSEVAVARVPTRHGEFEAHVYASLVTGEEHVALVRGDLGGRDPVLARLHSECLTGDTFGSVRCDCGPQLDGALAAVAAAGRGAVVYLRGHEGRGIGLAAKIRAYALQDTRGLDTVDANTHQGLPVDARTYDEGAQVLRDLGVGAVRLITNNPEKVAGLAAAGVDVVERVPSLVGQGPDNVDYLETKRRRLGHALLPPDLAHVLTSDD